MISKTWLAATAASLMVMTVPTAADAANIGIYGSNSNAQIATFLNANGHTVVQNMGSVAGANYSGLDAVILLRTPGDAATAAFVTGGGKLITEWNASTWVDSANLLSFDDVGGGFVGTGTTVSFTASGLAAGIGTGIGTSYSAGAASEFFRNFSNIGAGVQVWGTRPGGNATILAGASGAGFVIVNGADWADDFPSSSSNSQLLLNFLNVNATPGGVPEPATWAMMLLGFGAMGVALRRRPTVSARVRFA